MKQVKGIFFDLGWTLVKPAGKDWMRTKVFEKYCGMNYGKISPERQQMAQDTASVYLNEHHQLSTVEEETKQFTIFYQLLGKELPELEITPAKAEEIAWDRSHNMENYERIPMADQLLQTLQDKGYKMGIISDTWPSVREQIRALGIAPYVQTETYSFACGAFKPDPKLYQDALMKMKLPAEQTLFVDDLPGNLAGAAKSGINPVQAVLQDQKKPCGKYPYIMQLMDLPDLLNN